jgi:hypothetical protein
VSEPLTTDEEARVRQMLWEHALAYPPRGDHEEGVESWAALAARLLDTIDAARQVQVSVHTFDPDDRARAYNEGYDDALRHFNIDPATGSDRGHGLDVGLLARAITNVNCSDTGMSLDDSVYAHDLAREYVALMTGEIGQKSGDAEYDALRDWWDGLSWKQQWEAIVAEKLSAPRAAEAEAEYGWLVGALRTVPRHTTPDGEETYIEWAAVRDLIGDGG